MTAKKINHVVCNEKIFLGKLYNYVRHIYYNACYYVTKQTCFFLNIDRCKFNKIQIIESVLYVIRQPTLSADFIILFSLFIIF